MKNLQSVLLLAIDFLKKHRVPRARLIAESLLAHFLKLKRIELYMYFERPLIEEELFPFRAALKRAISGEPLEYILGEIEFYHTKLHVTPAVLIPRQETEILLDLVCKRLGGSEKNALDLCTGSGCLAIGLKKSHPHLNVIGIDISKEALDVADQNAKKNDVEIEWLQGDLTAPIKEKKFDLVICNPPYIEEGEYESLEISVRKFEPKGALIAGPTGYEFFERLSKELPSILNPGAKVFFEIGANQGKHVVDYFLQKPWKDLHIEKDWAGLDRFFSLVAGE